ncbi:MAG TPA: phosphotransferase [Acidimicrobiia bacterium]|nr:phosphotransferase [Acidimicrobiia bacterium]
MTPLHPATARVADPDLPAVSILLGEAVPGPVAAVVEAAGGAVAGCHPVSVTWWPGISVTVRFAVTVEGGELVGPQEIVAVGGRIPDGSVILEAEDTRIGVWRVPHDPALPGLAPALDDARTARLLTDLGSPTNRVATRLRAYRPGRRAVVSVSGERDGIYLKVLRPKKIAQLHHHHKLLSDVLPVPVSLGYSSELGLMALQALPGRTLRDALEDPAGELPAPTEVVSLVTDLPAPPSDRPMASIIEKAPAFADLFKLVVPSEAAAVDRFVEELGEEDDQDLVPVHGDFYEAQILTEGGRVVGFLDVDTFGLGRRGDDPGVMLGHLALWETMSSRPVRVRAYARELLEVWDRLYDPRDIRRRAAAALFTLASGPFRVQTLDWPGETASRIALAQTWLDSARR